MSASPVEFRSSQLDKFELFGDQHLQDRQKNVGWNTDRALDHSRAKIEHAQGRRTRILSPLLAYATTRY